MIKQVAKMVKRNDDRPTRLVYSTETGRIRDEPEEEQILGDGRVRVQLVKNGRGGKMVTCISGLPLKASELAVLGKQLKKDRKSTRLNSSHVRISYAVFCLKKKKETANHPG